MNKVIIMDWMSPYIKFGDYMDAYKVEFSPGLEKYAVIELVESKVFVSVLVCEITENGLIGEYMDSYEEMDSLFDSHTKYFIDWNAKDFYGYAMLMCKGKDEKSSVVKKRIWCDKTRI